MSVTLNDQMTIDHVIRVDADGTISDAMGVYAPEINCDYDGPFSEASITDSREADMIENAKEQGWTLETGWTGQYSYSGAIMHPSEYIGGRLEEHIRETPGYWVALSVELHPGEDDPEYDNGSGESESAGWVLAYRPPGVNMDKSTTDNYEGAALPLPHADYPHEPGRLYGCPACEAECFCTRTPGSLEYTKCVFCALLEEEQ